MTRTADPVQKQPVRAAVGAFLGSSVLMVIGLLIRHGVHESPDFEAVRARVANRPPSALAVIRRMPKLLLLVAGANTVGVASVYFLVVFMLTYTTQYLHLPRAMMLDCVFVATLLQLCMQPIGAWIADKVGTNRFVLATSLITCITPFILYLLVNQGSQASILAGLSICVFFGAGFYAAIAGFSASQFPTEVRYSAISISYQGCAAIVGGLTPIIGTVLVETFPGNWVPLAVAHASMAAISTLCIAKLTWSTEVTSNMSGPVRIAHD